MRRIVFVFCLLVSASIAAPGQAADRLEPQHPDWQQQVLREMPLLGHRNWILIVDSAYPLQSSDGIETIETGADEFDVIRFVMHAVGRSIHVRPDILMDAELPFVPEADAPGVSKYRAEIRDLLAGQAVESVPHQQLIDQVDQAGRKVHVLVLKTNMTVPYSSVFLRLNCKYWSNSAERRLRARMAAGPAGAP
ncbi:MAG TPA: RbsD/FucU domain-containing protein [Terracidiphilus sp.]|jgi:hypothetical protein|nr:RbsD/FucU domain-containing protein [Terracidiphilus sp.]